MKRKKLYALLGFEAVLIGTLVLLTDRFPALVSSLPAFPFAQLSLGIAAIAQVGSLGNGLAVALWAGISLLPAVIALRKDPAMSVGERISLFFLRLFCLRRCTALVVTTASPAVVNAAQLLFLPRLSQADTAVEFPLISIVFTLILLLLSRLLVENKRLREDNDLFI